MWEFESECRCQSLESRRHFQLSTASSDIGKKFTFHLVLSPYQKYANSSTRNKQLSISLPKETWGHQDDNFPRDKHANPHSACRLSVLCGRIKLKFTLDKPRSSDNPNGINLIRWRIIYHTYDTDAYGTSAMAPSDNFLYLFFVGSAGLGTMEMVAWMEALLLALSCLAVKNLEQSRRTLTFRSSSNEPWATQACVVETPSLPNTINSCLI